MIFANSKLCKIHYDVGQPTRTFSIFDFVEIDRSIEVVISSHEFDFKFLFSGLERDA